MNPSHRIRSILEIAFLALIASGTAWAAKLLVPEEYATIAEALGAASHGDTVSIASGTYYEHDLVLPPGVSVLGRGNRESVVIDAQGAGRVIWGEDLDESNALENLTLRGGYLPVGDGSGAYLDGPVLLRNLIVEENSNGSWGNGVGINARHLSLIEDCVFRNNRTPSMYSFGGGLRISGYYPGGCTLRRVDFIGNEGGYGAAFCGEYLTVVEVRAFENSGSSAIQLRDWCWIKNSVVAHNEASGIDVWGWATILNCTIVHCQSGVWSNGIPEVGGSAHIDNCIVAFNLEGYGVGCCPDPFDGGYAFLSCSDVYGNLPSDYFSCCWNQTGINGNISEDPLFCPDAGPEDYPLREDSPCAPANNSCGVLIGAFPAGCGVTATESTSWSRVKRLY